MNFTVDDADPSFSYSNGWAVQSDSDADRDEFFQSTYHVATADGASMSFQFQGSAFTLYGSKGPGHAKYQLQFDSTVVTLDASADETAFRQELFSHAFSSNGSSAVHLVKMTAILSGDGVKGKWLDVDYITFTSGSGAASSIGTATSTPPWETSQTASGSSSSSSSVIPFSGSTSPAASSSSSSSNKVPTVLAVLFGVLIGIALLVLTIYLILRRVYNRRRARERAFRYGQSSINPSGFSAASAASAASQKSAPSGTGGGGGGSGSGFIDTVTSVFGGGGSPRSPTPSSPMMNYTHMHELSAPSLSLSNHALEMRGMSIDRPQTREGLVQTPSSAREGAGTPTTSRPLLSASPIAWTRQLKVAGGHKGDADSLRTDFLQV
ncbi:hypothetical protein L226DRAFT_208400 [Lentinus tigrinus ALCF2SS1-7]|uniref:uncharacterized protein n=1 Tax=Lentinus tigrinus ALCF2SS1-7 TaxID=1328758 RepID=UPI0011662733|nr:hypothetical protein L226DRAFT_208400 [Lentinus tigrinus ALCF2SS1-7]